MKDSYDRNSNREGHRPIQQHLEEQFGQMRPTAAVPKQLKEEVFNTLDTLHLVADMIDLFTVKFAQTESEFLDLFQQQSSSEEGEE